MICDEEARETATESVSSVEVWVESQQSVLVMW
jgi:hypothetical protein